MKAIVIKGGVIIGNRIEKVGAEVDVTETQAQHLIANEFIKLLKENKSKTEKPKDDTQKPSDSKTELGDIGDADANVNESTNAGDIAGENDGPNTGLSDLELLAGLPAIPPASEKPVGKTGNGKGKGKDKGSK